MKKILVSTLFVAFMTNLFSVVSAAPFGLVSPTNEGTSSFAPFMQYEFEKKETLDFQNNPEEYKQKRKEKDRYLDYQAGKLDLTPDVRSRYNIQNSAPGTNNLQFIKGDDGQIKIMGF